MSQSTPHAPASGKFQKLAETNSVLLVVFILLMVSVGGLVEIVPLFYLKNTIEKVEGVRPYSPLELAGYNIYVREGCYVCHSQMIRPLRDEVERYGHYSLAAESMYDHPFQWGSKRTGPDIARVGGKYSNDWQRDHLRDPRAVVPPSIMPGYPFLATTPLKADHIQEQMRTLRIVGVPYTDEDIEKAPADLFAQSSPDAPGAAEVATRYPNAVSADSPSKTGPTEEDALVAYLQHLGAGVDFKIYDDKANVR